MIIWIIILPVCILFVLGFTGCSKWLDIKPESEIVVDEYWQTESDATSVVAACYKAFTEYDCMSRMILWGEGRSDNVVPYFLEYPKDYDLNHLTMFSFDADNHFCSWAPFYTIINYCNSFLYYAPKVVERDPNFTRAELQSLTAEVKTLRALAYFYLVRAFGKVPYVVEPSINDQQDYEVAQTDGEVILGKLISDLNESLLNAPTTYGTDEYTKGRITKNAIKALLADIYLWEMQYDNCVTMCDEIMSDKSLSFVTQKRFRSVFYDGNSSESIFELQFGTAADSKMENTAMRDYYRGEKGWGQGRLGLSSFLVGTEKSPFKFNVGSTIESENDSRFKDFLYPLGAGSYMSFKYTGRDRVEDDKKVSYYTYSTGDLDINWIIYRLSDIVLMKAEALVQLNRDEDKPEVMRLVNTTYLRSNPDASDSLLLLNYSKQNQLNDLVLRERQRELLFEGKRWFDLMRIARRTNSVAGVFDIISSKLVGSSIKFSSKSRIEALDLPVYSGELKANSKLVQNSYYEISKD